MAEVVLKPGEVLVVRCEVGDTDPIEGGGPYEGPLPMIGESLTEFGLRVGGPDVGPDHEHWPKGPDGEPVPGTHVWDGADWVGPA